MAAQLPNNSDIVEKIKGQGRETALIVHPVLPWTGEGRSYVPTTEEQVEEAVGLAKAIKLEVLDIRVAKVNKPNPAFLIGSGVADEIAETVKILKPTVVIVNHNLSPGQQQKLERKWKAKVIDRTGLILEIFGARAATREGQLQVDLAQLEYQRSRLVNIWTHLERQRGGAGFLGGPGETQREMDRRHIEEKMKRLKRELEDVRRNRELQRKSREKVPFPIVALVGYTNAGKSTLFNCLTGANVFAEDLLFATLDPTLRRVTLPGGADIILSDTVGFISDLPTNLIAAFRATLEQTQYADIILHVRDAARPDTQAQKEDVIKILGDLQVDYEHDPRVIEVLNKMDLLDDEHRRMILKDENLPEKHADISALTGEGIDGLLGLLERELSRNNRKAVYHIPYSDGQAIAWLHERGKILAKSEESDYFVYELQLDKADIGRFKERFGYAPQENGNKNNEQERIHRRRD